MRLNCKIGDLVHVVDVRNTSLQCDNLLGLSMTKEFRPSTSNIVGTDLTKYKIVGFNQFAVDFMSAIRVHRMPIALNRTGNDIIVSPAYGVFAVNDESEILPEYLMLWFSRPEFDRYADFKSDSAIRGGFDWAELCNTDISLPPLIEQHKMVQDYQIVSKRIDLLKSMNNAIESVIQALFDKLFFDSDIQLQEAVMKQGTLPSEWNSTTIGHMCSVQTGPFGSQLHNEDYSSEGTPIITVEHLDGKYIAHRNLPLVSDDDYRRLIKYNLCSGDIVFSRVGSVDRAVIVSSYEDKWLFSGRCLRVRPSNPNHAIYYLWWFCQPVIKQLVISSAVGTTMPSINTKILSEIYLIVPPYKKLEPFCFQANSLMKMVWNNNAEIRKLEQMQITINKRIK